MARNGGTWEIDTKLKSLVGCDVRVLARSFTPGGLTPIPLQAVEHLLLPDQSQPELKPVYFEGNLLSFERRIGVVRVSLDAPILKETASDGHITFRGKLVVFIKGPAIVELESPLRIERLPANSENYWQDIKMPGAQFEFPWENSA